MSEQVPTHRALRALPPAGGRPGPTWGDTQAEEAGAADAGSIAGAVRGAHDLSAGEPGAAAQNAAGTLGRPLRVRLRPSQLARC